MWTVGVREDFLEEGSRKRQLCIAGVLGSVRVRRQGLYGAGCQCNISLLLCAGDVPLTMTRRHLEGPPALSPPLLFVLGRGRAML